MCHARLPGSNWEHVTLQLDIRYPPDFPASPMTIRCVTPVFHPNGPCMSSPRDNSALYAAKCGRLLTHFALPHALAVPCPVDGKTGKICADALQDKWSPTLTLHSLLPRLSSLLDEPNLVSKLNAPAGDLHDGNSQTAQYWAHVYLTHERNMNERLDAHGQSASSSARVALRR